MWSRTEYEVMSENSSPDDKPQGVDLAKMAEDTLKGLLNQRSKLRDHFEGARGQPAKALDVQVGGDHYKGMAIQPVQFCMANGLGFCEGNVVKYVCRRKGDRIEDLKKARHYLDLLIEHLEQNGAPS